MLTIHYLLLAFTIFCTNIYAETADLLIFTKDRPLQLQALLESLDVYVTGLQKIAVLCHAKNDRFLAGYKQLERNFPNVEFVYQSRNNPRQDFWPLIKDICDGMSSSYFMFGVDDTIIIDYMKIEECIAMMQQTDSYAFYPYMGKDITYCYMTQTQKLPPRLQNVGNNLCTWDLLAGVGPWGYIYSVYMTIYTRKEIDHLLHVLQAASPNQLEEMWGGNAIVYPQMKGLCYTRSHIINVPLNMVQYDCPQNNCSRRYSVEQLLESFEHKWRIDIQAFYQLQHNAPHTDTDIPLTKKPLRG